MRGFRSDANLCFAAQIRCGWATALLNAGSCVTDRETRNYSATESFRAGEKMIETSSGCDGAITSEQWQENWLTRSARTRKRRPVGREWDLENGYWMKRLSRRVYKLAQRMRWTSFAETTRGIQLWKWSFTLLSPSSHRSPSRHQVRTLALVLFRFIFVTIFSAY